MSSRDSEYTGEDRVAIACSTLISRRFVPNVRVMRSRGERMLEQNPLFDVVRGNEREIEQRLEAVGFTLTLDVGAGYASCAPSEGMPATDRVLDVVESKFLIALAIHYERSLAERGRYSCLRMSVNDVLSILTTEYGAFEKIPPAGQIRRALSRLERCSLIVKEQGSWEDRTCEFTVLPTIQAFTSAQAVEAFRLKYEEALGDLERGLDDIDRETEE